VNKIPGRLVALAISLCLGGCIAVGAVDRRAATLNEQVAQTQNQGVLLNLARAAREEPIYFMAMNQLSASGTTDFRVGAPQFFLGPRLPAPDQIATFVGGTTFLDNSTNSNFQMSLLGSKDFYNGLLSPLGLQDVDLLLHQGYSRELIFYLVIEKATITTIPAPGATAPPPQVIYNDPADAKTFPLFEYYIKEAMEHGLTTDTYEAPDETASDSNDQTASDAKAKSAKRPSLTTHAELCYDRALAIQKDIADIAPDSFCGAKPAVRRAGEGAVTGGLPVKLNGQNLQIDVTTRSIYGIFYYLGGVLRHEQQSRVQLRHYDLPAEDTKDEPLLQVVEGGHGDACFTSVSYEGKSYCVPREGADNTKRIFGILNALLALKQTITDQPVTQTVRIEQ
jgi:hypothetical protein